MAQLISGLPQGRMAARAIASAAILLLCLLAPGPSVASTISKTAAAISSPPGPIQALPDTAYAETLATLINNATRQVDLAMFLFKTSPARNNRPAELVRALIAARQRGVAVRVILEYSQYDPTLNRANQETAESLKQGGVAVFFDSPNRTSHAKLAVIDRRYCIVGSHNLTQSALTRNHEFSLLLDNPALAEEILAYMKTLPQ